MGYPRRLLSGGETVIREFRPHWRMLFVPTAWTVLLAAAVVLTWIFPPTTKWFDWGVTAVAGVAWLVLGLYPFVAWWFTSYVLTNERLITRRGILARHGLEIPLEQITNVLFSQNILERILRSGDLLIESAGTSGQSRFSDIPEPEEFQSLLYTVREERGKVLAGKRANGGDDAISQLERLQRLRAEGALTEEQFEEQKRRILGGEQQAPQ
ncbi:MAG: PH domain-containing protein [Acidimicrobiia bacterium]|nr:PH domain-containing protein [Acidimicrobiia bacterium]